MSETKVNLGFLPVNRGTYSNSATYYKDNIVQYNGSSYICTQDPGSGATPQGITGEVPYVSQPDVPNTHWAVFANNQGGPVEGIYDISANHATDNIPKAYESLSAALADVPTAKKTGGLVVKFIQTTPATYNVVKTEGVTEIPTGTLLDSASSVASGTYTASQLSDFSTLPTTSAVTYYVDVTEDETTTYTTWVITLVQSSDNKYVQARCMAQNFTTDVTQWQGVDNVPTVGSENLVKSGGVKKVTDSIHAKIDFVPYVNNRYYRYDNGKAILDTTLNYISSAIIETKEGDKWHVSSKGTGSAYPYYVVDAEFNVLQTSSLTNAVFSDDITVDEGGAYIIVNCVDARIASYSFFNYESVRQNKERIDALEESVTYLNTHTNGGLYQVNFFNPSKYEIIKDGTDFKVKYTGNSSSSNKFLCYTPDFRFFKISTSTVLTFSTTSIANGLYYVKESEIGHNKYQNAQLVTVYNSSWVNFKDTKDFIPLAIIENGILSYSFLIGAMAKDLLVRNMQECFIEPSSANGGVSFVSGTGVQVTFNKNPTFVTQRGKYFKLFPSDAESYTLAFDLNRIYYIDDSIIPATTTKNNPYYLSASDISYFAFTNNDVIADSKLNDKIILAMTNSSDDNGNLFNYGGIGRLYYDNLSGNLSKTMQSVIKVLNGVCLTYIKGKCYIYDSSTNKVDLMTLAAYSYMIMPVTAGEQWHVIAKGSGIAYPYVVVDSEYNVLNKSTVTNRLFDSIIPPIPEGAAYIIANCDNKYLNKFELYNVNSIKGNGDEIDAIWAYINGESSNVRYDFPSEPKYGGTLLKKCPNFYRKMKEKNSDVTVVLTGTSLSQGNLYATTRNDATTRPPLLHTNDLASAVFDKLINNWYGQQYRRYDHQDLVYSESTWEVTNDLVVDNQHIWDDAGSDKNGLTKTTTDANASVSISVPSDAWQFNFIYRSDSEGGNCTVSISEGNNKMEVFDNGQWVEANGYQFSMLEPAATSTKGNTCYQKRLKMRCKNKASGGINSIGTVKTLQIAKGNDSSRFNVVGFEWTPREYIFTLINGSRGSHQWGVSGDLNLEKYQDSDIWEFDPDLIMAEVTVINWGGSSATGLTRDPLYFVNNAKRAYFNEFNDDSDSLFETSEHWTECEVIFYGDTASGVHGDCWTANGNPAFGTVSTAATNGSTVSDVNVGKVKNVFENYDAVDNYMSSKEDYIFIPVTRVFKHVSEKHYGTYRNAFTQSGKDGATLTTDGTHLNDNGAALWALLICPVFDIF